MFKKFIIASLFLLTSVQACWWTSFSYDNNYIYAVNNFKIHYLAPNTTDSRDPDAAANTSGSNQVYKNNMYVDLPITVYVKINSDNTLAASNPITKAVLQYRIKRSGSWLTSWTTVKEINNPVTATTTWDIATGQNTSVSAMFDKPIPLFGNGTISPKSLQSGDVIYIRYYITDGVVQSGDLDEPLNSLSLSNYEYLQNMSTNQYNNYGGGWTAPFVTSVIWTGMYRVGWTAP